MRSGAVARGLCSRLSVATLCFAAFALLAYAAADMRAFTDPSLLAYLLAAAAGAWASLGASLAAVVLDILAPGPGGRVSARALAWSLASAGLAAMAIVATSLVRAAARGLSF
ncbi:MAG: hypothetical protein JW923_11825 [Spirochaetales bacterium]|nr:hypothetical protein [Spirochaetales bacterium]MBP7263513.1 hypothetical protein [Spirochaetia bacterium]